MLGKIEGRRRRGLAEDEVVGWHHRLNGHESEQIQEIVKDKEAWSAAVNGMAESDMTEQQQQQHFSHIT